MTNRVMEEFKFCPKCAGKLEKKRFNMLKCKACCFEWYQNPIPCNAAILENEKGEILLIKRKWPPNAGDWDLPGGFIDLGENLKQSIKRELKEELGVKVDDLKFYKACDQGRYLFQGVDFYTLCFIFVGKIGNKKVQALDDVGSIEYFPKDKIPYKKIAFKTLAKALKKYVTP